MAGKPQIYDENYEYIIYILDTSINDEKKYIIKNLNLFISLIVNNNVIFKFHQYLKILTNKENHEKLSKIYPEFDINKYTNSIKFLNLIYNGSEFRDNNNIVNLFMFSNEIEFLDELLDKSKDIPNITINIDKTKTKIYTDTKTDIGQKYVNILKKFDKTNYNLSENIKKCYKEITDIDDDGLKYILSEFKKKSNDDNFIKLYTYINFVKSELSHISVDRKKSINIGYNILKLNDNIKIEDNKFCKIVLEDIENMNDLIIDLAWFICLYNISNFELLCPFSNTNLNGNKIIFYSAMIKYYSSSNIFIMNKQNLFRQIKNIYIKKNNDINNDNIINTYFNLSNLYEYGFNEDHLIKIDNTKSINDKTNINIDETISIYNNNTIAYLGEIYNNNNKYFDYVSFIHKDKKYGPDCAINSVLNILTDVYDFENKCIYGINTINEDIKIYLSKYTSKEDMLLNISNNDRTWFDLFLFRTINQKYFHITSDHDIIINIGNINLVYETLYNIFSVLFNYNIQTTETYSEKINKLFKLINNDNKIIENKIYIENSKTTYIFNNNHSSHENETNLGKLYEYLFIFITTFNLEQMPQLFFLALCKTYNFKLLLTNFVKICKFRDIHLDDDFFKKLIDISEFINDYQELIQFS